MESKNRYGFLALPSIPSATLSGQSRWIPYRQIYGRFRNQDGSFGWEKRAKPLSLSRRSAKRYLFLLIFLLCIAVILGFVVSTANNLKSEIQKLIDSSTELTEKIVSETDVLEPVIGQKKFSEAVAPDQQKAIALLQSQLHELYYLLDEMLQKNQVLTRLRSFGFLGKPYVPGNLEPAEGIQGVREVVRSYYYTRRDIASDLLKESIIIGIISSSILPIVLGVMGACAYVIRLISDQIKDSTFSTTAPDSTPSASCAWRSCRK